jgi:hypothetical protein
LFEPYQLTFKHSHSQCNVSEEGPTQDKDVCCGDASTIWTCTKRFPFSPNETLFSYTRPILPSFLFFGQNIKSPSSSPLKTVDETKRKQITSFQNNSYNFPKVIFFFF